MSTCPVTPKSLLQLTSESRSAPGRRRCPLQCRAPGGATLFAVVMEKAQPFFRQAINVRRFVTHHAIAIRADVGNANVVAPEDEDVRFLARGLRGHRGSRGHED